MPQPDTITITPAIPAIPALTRIECPYCATSYTSARCGIPVDLDVVFTIVCGTCKRQIDGAVETVEVPGKPATTLHKWTWGYLGVPGTEPASTRIVKVRAS